ncbi:MAG: hypothetical protein KAJ19_04615 [Gammaproteobacteria bacterium]|nr:hypothetical protein [Gammaproteobacteria bacterium]
MKKPTKAMLLSALIFPGLGHLFLKRYIAALVLLSVSFSAIYYLASKAVERALQISAKIQSGEVSPDIATITALVEKQSTGAEAQLLNIATVAFVVCWLVGIIDSYRVGCTRDKSDDVQD